MEEQKVRTVKMPVRHIDRVALQSVSLITAIHAMENVIIDNDEKAEMAKAELANVITKGIEKVSEFFSIATIISNGSFEEHTESDDDDVSVEEACAEE